MSTLQLQAPAELQQVPWYTGMHVFLHWDATHEPDPLLLPLPPEDAAQEPPWHVWLFVVQSKHDCPLDPHAVFTVPDWQLLLESQQPLHAAEAHDTAPLLLPESPLPDPPLDELLPLLLPPPLPPLLFPESSPPDPPLDELLVLLLGPPDDEEELLLDERPESSTGAPESLPPGGMTPPASPEAHPATTNVRQTARSTKRMPLLGSGAPWRGARLQESTRFPGAVHASGCTVACRTCQTRKRGVQKSRGPVYRAPLLPVGPGSARL
jgi:hypothetical protein